jgi:hypothetical protein
MRPHLLASILAVMGTPLAAQVAPQCTYDRCALMVKEGWLGRRLVQGSDETHVAQLAFFPRPLPLFAERSDSAAIRYDAFRRKQISSTSAMLLGVVAFAGAAIAAGDSDAATTGLLLLGLGSWTFGIVRSVSASNDLARAVWLYNRGFP